MLLIYPSSVPSQIFIEGSNGVVYESAAACSQLNKQSSEIGASETLFEQLSTSAGGGSSAGMLRYHRFPD